MISLDQSEASITSLPLASAASFSFCWPLSSSTSSGSTSSSSHRLAANQRSVCDTRVLTNQRPVLPVLVPSPVLAVPHHPILLLLLLLRPELPLGVECPALTNEKRDLAILTNERLIVLTSLGSSVAHSGRWSLFSCL